MVGTNHSPPDDVLPVDVMAWVTSRAEEDRHGAGQDRQGQDRQGQEKDGQARQEEQEDRKKEEEEGRALETSLEIRKAYDYMDGVCEVAVYREACRRQGVPPVDHVCSAISTPYLSVKNRQMGAPEVKALAIALVRNTEVTSLELEGTGLNVDGLYYMYEMLNQNQYITSLSVGENNLRSDGAQLLCHLMLENRTITELHLTGNAFEDSDGKYFAKMIKYNPMLRKLSLGHNKLRERGGEDIGRALESGNVGLEELDLSWNHLRLKGAATLCSSLQFNNSLLVLDLSFNGLSESGCRPLAEALTTNTSLLELDVSNNRIGPGALKHVLKGLTENTALRTLKIGDNPLTAPCALDLLCVITLNKRSAITMLSLNHIPVDEAFLNLVSQLRQQRPLHVTHDRVHYRDDHVTR